MYSEDGSLSVGCPIPFGQSLRLSSKVPFVILQFSFSNPDAIPECVRGIPNETREESRVRRSGNSAAPTGRQVIEPVESCSLATFADEICDSGYELINVLYQARIDRNRPKNTYHMVRFVFKRSEHISLLESLRNVHKRMLLRENLEALRTICAEALWRVRSYLNPCFRNGEEIRGERSVSINLEAREPLFRPSGERVTVWKKDGNGRRIGSVPMPLEPKKKLEAWDGVMCLK